MQEQRNKIDFSNQNIYAGLDVHRKDWKVSIMVNDILHKTYVQPPDPKVLFNYLSKNFPGGNYKSAYEAGFCGFWIHNELTKAGIKSIIANPADIPTTNKEKQQKEDKRDSRKLAKCLKNNDLTPIYIPSDKTIDDRLLVRMRGNLVKDLRRNKQRIKSFLYFTGIQYPDEFFKSSTHWSKRFILWLEQLCEEEKSSSIALRLLLDQGKFLRSNLLEVTRKIKALSKTDHYIENSILLQSVPGIGLITSMIILTELETIERFNSLDKLCSYIGLIPTTNSSGDKDKTGDITPRGHSVLRSALIESAWVAVRQDPALMIKYIELCKRMDKNQAIVRMAKKLVSRIVYVLRNKKQYVKSVIK